MRKLLVFAAFAAMVAAVAACTGDDDDDAATSPATSPSPSPSPTATTVYRNVTSALTNSNIATGTVMIRFKSAGTTDVCITRTSAAGAATLATNGKLVDGRTYDVVEFVIDQNGNNVADASPGTDHSYSHAAVTVTADVSLPLNHSNPGAGGWTLGDITWDDATGCPGP